MRPYLDLETVTFQCRSRLEGDSDAAPTLNRSVLSMGFQCRSRLEGDSDWSICSPRGMTAERFNAALGLRGILTCLPLVRLEEPVPVSMPLSA